MSNLTVIEKKTDVKATIEAATEMMDSLDGVMIVGLDKEGRQHLWTSTMSQMEKCFLTAFLNAWATKWFKLDEPS